MAPSTLPFPVSLPQRLLNDCIELAVPYPVARIHRCLRLRTVVAGREVALPKPGWCALFTKALAQACRAEFRGMPEAGRPDSRWSEDTENCLTVAIERLVEDRPAVFLSPVPHPERMSLVEIDALIRGYKDRPLESIPALRQQLRLASLPRWLRQKWLRFRLAWAGRERTRLLGTMAIMAMTDTTTRLQPPPLPVPVFSYGPVDANGEVQTSLTFDPCRVSATAVARLLDDLERIFCNDILAELRYLQRLEAA